MALATVNVLFLLTAAVGLNNSYRFFASWDDVAQTMSGPVSAATVQHGQASPIVATNPVPENPAPSGAPLKPLPQPVGPDGVGRYEVRGPRSGLTGIIEVRVPPGAKGRLPVLETFAGFPSDPSQWLKAMDLGNAVDAAQRKRQLRAPLIVSVQTQFPQGVDTECVNGGPGRPAVEDWLALDVPEWVVEHFLVSKNRNSWATIGLSSGGYCAAMAAMKHPAQFGGAVVMGGYFRPIFSRNYRPFTATSPQARDYDLIELAKKAPPPVRMWLQTSRSDRVSIRTSAPFLSAVRAPMSVDAMTLKDAGHSMLLWQGLLPKALRWLGTHVEGFAHPVR